MKIVKNAVLRDDKRIPISMIIIACFMLILSIADISILFVEGTVALSISINSTWSSLLSIIPMSWGISVGLLLKTKKPIFAKMPGYIICVTIAMAYILYYIFAGQDNVVGNILLFSIAVLLIYPFIIATLTIEGRIYNRVFATVFTGILLALTLIAAIVLCVLRSRIMLSLLIPALVYVELLLAVFCYRLEKPAKTSEGSKVITH